MKSGEVERRATERLVRGESWADFCESLKVAGRMVEAFDELPSDQDRAEWYRFLSRLVRNGFERFMENCEPERPRLRDAPWRCSINAQNPDQDHLMCEFPSGEFEYRITGTRGTLPYFVMAVWSAPQPADLAARDWAEKGREGLAEFDPAILKTTAFLQSDAIDFDDEGRFEVVLSAKPPARNGLQLLPDSTGILIRLVYHERAKTVPPQFAIERIDRPRPRPVRADEVAAALAKSGQLVLGYAELVRDWWQNNLSLRPNTIVFSEATYLSNGGVRDRLHGFGCWEKARDEALVVRFTPTPCEYWVLQICNLWQENLDCYEDGQGYVTKFNARHEADGSVVAVLADADPGVGGHWVDAFQHEKGLFSLRFIKTEGGPAVTIHRVALARLKEAGLAAILAEPGIASGEVTD
ncbi:MAG: hypothetical protein R3F35_21220 [Myxococcota bacterium]